MPPTPTKEKNKGIICNIGDTSSIPVVLRQLKIRTQYMLPYMVIKNNSQFFPFIFLDCGIDNLYDHPGAKLQASK